MSALNTVLERFSLATVIDWSIALVIVIFGFIIGAIVGRWVKTLSRFDYLDSAAAASTVSIASRMAQSFIIVASAIIALDVIGIDLGPVLASAGVLGVVVGFGLKNVAENYISGVILAFRRAFVIGDEIIVDGDITGRVEELSLRYIRLRTRDGLRVYVPNSTMLNQTFVNLTRNGTRRAEFRFTIDYANDLQRACDVAILAINEVKLIDTTHKPQVWVSEFDSAGVVLVARFWYEPTGLGEGLRSRAMIAVKEAFEKENITLPSNVYQFAPAEQPHFPLDPGD
ncbi:hypothetical protein CPHO_06685 [Corynebacterium phocae]|uniref:Mechanosensitive ion channel protein MscS n=1 Tax=Corynebacterium phocae TaxID=161895 RepID=A0A1L7D3P6_9CORY|nr:mechanosensitive ion channel family protein [Corynebacterium phocae]APT92631.1 hypothetical protein CPHO_06685 [Corynebacterium phocae]KAA8724188.1 mechanosensitive ion channel family protein [Corynebacterium phocae]